MKGMIVTLVTGSWWQLWSRDKLWSQPAAPAAADQPATTHSDQPAAASHCNSRMILKYQTHQNNLTKSHKKITKNTNILNLISIKSPTKHLSIDNPRYNYYNILLVCWCGECGDGQRGWSVVTCHMSKSHVTIHHCINNFYLHSHQSQLSVQFWLWMIHTLFYIFIRIMQLQNDQYFLRHQNCFLQKYFSRYFV